ncbi:hypothetical protein GOOTI_184_00030 [Gordonia otitidis NBRC 100426]|uniref:DinB-like domain-containing protein n=2 Tax=Gordonia otitidis TaxID=249058 RepID=H5TQQ4_GORO1|nr:hypothetical protein GOOTI_184_00030 [Gordonia otitidis NBRC 100426]
MRRVNRGMPVATYVKKRYGFESVAEFEGYVARLARHSDQAWSNAALDTAERCWDGFVATLDDLSDDDLNRRLAAPGSNTPYALVHHCIEMTRWWLGTFGCGLDIPRDRAGEFEATGTRADLVERIAQVRRDADVWATRMLREGIAARAARGTNADVDLDTVTPEWVLLHVVHELAQHLGQLQVTRDLLRD